MQNSGPALGRTSQTQHPTHMARDRGFIWKVVRCILICIELTNVGVKTSTGPNQIYNLFDCVTADNMK
jgi:hypothetical protein